MASLVAMTLDDLGVKVVPAATFTEAITAATAERPSLVLLDLVLGDEDGLEILPDLRRDPAFSGVPVVVFTVHDSLEEKARLQGVDGFVSKPFKAETLRRAVEPFLGEKP